MGIPPQMPPPAADRPSREQWRAQRAQWKMQARMQRAAYRASYRGHVRGSILGPLFLIAIGIIALLMTTHHMNAGMFWHWYAHWWPLLLIGAGMLLALESLVWARYSRIRVGAGVVFFLFLLALVGIGISHNHVNWTSVGHQFGDNFDLAQIFGSKHQASEQVVHALPANATLVIQNGNGDVTIGAGSDDQMHLTLDKVVYSNSDADAQRQLAQMEPLITSSGSVVTVHMPTGDRQVANLTLAVPASAAVQARTGHGDVTVNGCQAAVTIHSSGGDVQLTGIAGPVQVTMRHGDFSASNLQGGLILSGRMNDVTISQITGSSTLTGDFFGDVHLQHLTGPAHFHSRRTDIQLARLDGSASLNNGDLTVENATGPVSISTHAMDITLRRILGAVEVNNSDGGVTVQALDPVGAMTIDNRNGSVQVTVPEDAKFSVQGTAVNGQVNSDFNLSAENARNHSTASGSVGGGGPLLHIAVKNGDITLHKAAANAGQ